MKLKKVISIREALASQDYFGRLLEGASWAAWRVLLIAICGEELTEDERVVFKALTGRESEPLEPCEEFWAVIGRRGGKTRAMAVLAAYIAALVDHHGVLGPGERGVVPILAASTQQAVQAYNFTAGVFANAPQLKGLVETATADTLRLRNGIDIQIRPASFRTIRGVTAVAVICDEIAYWRSEESANPDKEILAALRPSLATTGGLLCAISSPYAKRGELYETWSRHFGPKGDPTILVAQGASRDFNPSLAQKTVDRAMERDPAAAAAEYLGQFRSDVDLFIDRDAIEACVSRGVIVRPPLDGVTYFGFIDPSGGSSDSMTCAIAHNEAGRVVIDCLLERRPPFSPDAVAGEFAETLKAYRITSVRSDRYGGEWPRERFQTRGIQCLPAEMDRSALYLAFLPLVNSGRIDLLDNQRLLLQFIGLERRVARSGKDSVDHAPGSHDDLSNAVAGAAAMAVAPVVDIPITAPIVITAADCAPEARHWADARTSGFTRTRATPW